MKTKLLAFIISMLAPFLIVQTLSAQSLAVNKINYSYISQRDNDVTAISLKNVLKQIESRFNISIAYQSGLIKDKSLALDVSAFSSPEAALNKALASFDLNFEKVRERFYLVSSQKLKANKSFDITEDDVPVSLSQNVAHDYAGMENRISPIGNIRVPKAVPPKTITGRVTDANEVGLIGASVNVKGTKIGATTDMSGHFSLTIPSEDVVLVFSMVGYAPKEVRTKGLSDIRVVLDESATGMEEVVITAFGTHQKKESVVSAITTIDPTELRVPASNLTSAFAGRMAGVIAYQRSGEPGLDNAEFFIRGITSFSASGKKDPLILIDGVEMTTNDLARLNVDDIASFSIMKDASAAALYGARGANGVILIKTKEGKIDKLSINARAERANSYNSKLVKLADPVTYMKLHNEAVRTRDAMVELPYSPYKIMGTELGTDPLLYPSVNWYDYLLQDHAPTSRVNVNLTGGGQSVQYYLSANYQNDQGILKESKENLFNNNINIDRLQIRSNVTIKFAPTTTGVVRAYGSFDDQTGPWANTTDWRGRNLSGGAAVFQWARNASPVFFLPYYPADSANVETKHILFGMNQENNLINPLANVVSSFKESKQSMLLLQLEMQHKFTGALKGVVLKGTYNVMRNAYYDLYRGYNPFYYSLATTLDKSYQLMALNPDGGTEYLNYVPGTRTVNAANYGEVNLNYHKTFNEKHDFNAMLVGTIRSETGAISIDRRVSDQLQASLPKRNISSAGRLAYGYDSRYFVELDYGYNGTERFARKNRFGFFPAIGAGWMVSNEAFMSGVKDIITTLKLKGTYGKVGNDQIGDSYDRFFYLSQVNMNGTGYWFGEDRGYRSGITINRYANPLITWEVAKKANVGIELGLFNDLTILADFFHETRSNILQDRADIPTTMGIRGIPQANLGVAEGKGFEAELKYQKSFNRHLWLTVNGNFTYASAKFKEYEEPDYSDVPWRSHIGTKLSQTMGLIAERLFIDDEEVANSPVQQFGEYGAGDIKYKDINNDGVINNDDMVPIGFPTVPEIIYGTGFSLGYKAFDFSVFFQGSARSSFSIAPDAITPFINKGQRGLLQYIADDHWSENNRDVYAFWPRLSEYAIANNNVSSTHWLRNGAFVRLKQAEIGYTLPERLTKKAFINSLRFYVSGTNLYLWSKFKMWDPEMAGNGLGYPVQRVINFGVNLNFK
jgi:TonB-linked SusC/RagA family outer membrane protein